MDNKPDPVAGDQTVVRGFMGAAGGAIALFGPMSAAAAIDNTATSVLTAAFSSAVGIYLIANAVDRSVVLIETFKNKAKMKLGACLIGASLVSLSVGCVNVMKHHMDPLLQPPVPTTPVLKV